jgi:hypothetical protein
MRSEVLTEVNIMNTVLWKVMPHSLVDRYQCLGGTYSPNLESIRVKHEY